MHDDAERIRECNDNAPCKFKAIASGPKNRPASRWVILRMILRPIVAGMYHCWYAESIQRSHIVYVYVNQAYNAAQLCLGPLLEDVAEIFTITDRSFGQKLHVWNCNS